MGESEKSFKAEALEELQKPLEQLAEDIFREANTLPSAPAGEKENLDIIKHLIKRLAAHQISLENKTQETNRSLIRLSVIMAIGSIFSILSFLLQLCMYIK